MWLLTTSPSALPFEQEQVWKVWVELKMVGSVKNSGMASSGDQDINLAMTGYSASTQAGLTFQQSTALSCYPVLVPVPSPPLLSPLRANSVPT